MKHENVLDKWTCLFLPMVSLMCQCSCHRLTVPFEVITILFKLLFHFDTLTRTWRRLPHWMTNSTTGYQIAQSMGGILLFFYSTFGSPSSGLVTCSICSIRGMLCWHFPLALPETEGKNFRPSVAEMIRWDQAILAVDVHRRISRWHMWAIRQAENSLWTSAAEFPPDDKLRLIRTCPWVWPESR